MIYYVDTSLVISAVTGEMRAEAVQEWLEQHWDYLIISDWVVTEAAAALAKQVRTNRLTSSEQLQAALLFERQFVSRLTVLPVSRAEFRSAARFCERAELGLRAGDALHLAIASTHTATLVTGDKRQSDAGERLRLKTLLLA